MFRFVFFLFLFVVSAKISAASLPAPIQQATDQWDKFVSKFVDEHGGFPGRILIRPEVSARHQLDTEIGQVVIVYGHGIDPYGILVSAVGEQQALVAADPGYDGGVGDLQYIRELCQF